MGFLPRVWLLRFQTTNTSVMEWFWMNSMLILEVLWNIVLYEEQWYQKREKEAILGNFPKWYRYQNRAVPVPPSRSQSVPVPVQAVPVPPNRTRSVPVPIRAVPVSQCPKCPELCSFAYLSLKSYSVSIGTLLND